MYGDGDAVAALAKAIMDCEDAMDLVSSATARMVSRLQRFVAGEADEGERPETAVSAALLMVMAVAYKAGARSASEVGLPKEVTQ